MPAAEGAILALNAGSSSLKFALRIGDALRARGEIERISQAPHFRAHDGAGALLEERGWAAPPGFEALFSHVLGWCDAHLGGAALEGVGHRVVHGGAAHVRPERVTPDLLAALDRLTPLAPLHEPHNLAPIRAIAALRPGLPQVACFDTAFHHTMPAVATRLGIPREMTAAGIRRYGFHGLSYEWIAGRLAALDPALAGGRVIAAHLGNGASLCAMRRAGASTPRWASPRWTGSSWAPVPARSTPASSSISRPRWG